MLGIISKQPDIVFDFFLTIGKIAACCVFMILNRLVVCSLNLARKFIPDFISHIMIPVNDFVLSSFLANWVSLYCYSG